jgi:hypothetical protein
MEPTAITALPAALRLVFFEVSAYQAAWFFAEWKLLRRSGESENMDIFQHNICTI